MNAINIALALEAMIRLTMQTQQLAALINTARAEGRDINDAELASLASADDTARQELEAAIAAAKLREAG